MDDIEPHMVELMTEINYTRSVTRSWIRVLLSEEAQLDVVAEQISIYVTLPSIPLPWDTARIIKEFLFDDTKPVVVNSPVASPLLHVVRHSLRQLSHSSYALVEPPYVQAALEERVCQERALYDMVRARSKNLLMANAHNYEALQILKQKIGE